jgi:hypothetical protein
MLGAVVGGVTGYTLAWRLARKLEAHGVRLRDWDHPYAPDEPTKEAQS